MEQNCGVGETVCAYGEHCGEPCIGFCVKQTVVPELLIVLKDVNDPCVQEIYEFLQEAYTRDLAEPWAAGPNKEYGFALLFDASRHILDELQRLPQDSNLYRLVSQLKDILE